MGLVHPRQFSLQTQAHQVKYNSTSPTITSSACSSTKARPSLSTRQVVCIASGSSHASEQSSRWSSREFLYENRREILRRLQNQLAATACFFSRPRLSNDVCERVQHGIHICEADTLRKLMLICRGSLFYLHILPGSLSYWCSSVWMGFLSVFISRVLVTALLRDD